jgi:thiosulfate/3-mercaptopyruvate sulfurtransferase
MRATVLGALLLAPSLAFAQPAPTTARADGPAVTSRLIAPASAATLLGTPGLVLLQMGSPAQFSAGHIPGARPVALANISATRDETPLALELPAAQRLSQWAQSVGITDASTILVIPSTDTLQSSTRLLFTLEVMGFGDRVQLLDGGFPAWQRAGLPVETGAAPELTTTAAAPTVQIDSSRIATIEDVAQAATDPAVFIVDARLPEFYRGIGGGYPRPGHIPSAVNIPLNTVAEGGAFKSREELQALFTAAGVKPGAKVITYCHIGQQASLLWFTARELGYDVRLFDGSFQQWSGSDRPLGTPPPAP